MSDFIICEISNAIATITLNRPTKLNALSYALIDKFLARLDVLEADDAVRAIIVTGAGNRAFSAGGDIHEFAGSIARGTLAATTAFVRRGQVLTARLEAFPKPIIAAVNGLAYGGGCEIVEAVHLAVASDQAMFAKPEIKLGMPPTFGGTQRLPRLAGRKRALELLLSGDPFTPARAQELGLVNLVVPHQDLMNAAMQMAGKIIENSPAAISAILSAVTRGLNMTIGEGLIVECEQFARLVPTHELAEGLNAWIARRRAVYGGT